MLCKGAKKTALLQDGKRLPKEDKNSQVLSEKVLFVLDRTLRFVTN